MRTSRTATTDQQDSHNRPTGQPQQTNRTATTDQQDSHSRPTGQSQDSHNRPTRQPDRSSGEPHKTGKHSSGRTTEADHAGNPELMPLSQVAAITVRTAREPSGRGLSGPTFDDWQNALSPRPPAFSSIKFSLCTEWPGSLPRPTLKCIIKILT